MQRKVNHLVDCYCFRLLSVSEQFFRFLIAAVSPAVVVPSLIILHYAGWGVEKGVPTLVMAASGIDDVLAISRFCYCWISQDIVSSKYSANAFGSLGCMNTNEPNSVDGIMSFF